MSVFRSQLLADRSVVAVIRLSLQNLSVAFYKLPGDFLSAQVTLKTKPLETVMLEA